MQSKLHQQIWHFREDIHFSFDLRTEKEINNALDLMLSLHSDQKDRPDGTPYVMHPLSVAASVLEFIKHKEKELIIAALLHDAVEDQSEKLADKNSDDFEGSNTDNALRYIEHNFGLRVRKIITELTNPDFDKEMKSLGIPPTQESKHNLYVDHVVDAIQEPDVALIKYFDFADNAYTIDQVTDPQRRKKFIKKYTPLFDHYIKRFEDTTRPVNIKEEKRVEVLLRLRKVQKHLQQQLKTFDNHD